MATTQGKKKIQEKRIIGTEELGKSKKHWY